MTRTNLRAISIAPDHNKAHLSKGQKAFNTLIKQIEKRRARLSAWEAAMPAFHRKYLSEFSPLQQTSIDLRTKLVHRLDQTYGLKGLTKSERRTIADLISDLAGQLVAESDDPELKTIYNRYSESDFDSEAAAELDDMKLALEAMLGTTATPRCYSARPRTSRATSRSAAPCTSCFNPPRKTRAAAA